MATDVIMPALGVAQVKGTLLNWLKAEGQPVTKGEPLMEVETDKATVEIEAPASNHAQCHCRWSEIPVGNKIAVIQRLANGDSGCAQDPHPALPVDGKNTLAPKHRLKFTRERNQIPISLCQRDQRIFLRNFTSCCACSHLPKESKRKESISNPSKEVGLAAVS
jgi:pyruvate/2-oxoglutarate dehydrogenase complex dihydrolipoamide acyltransferase (E2) component